MPFTITARLSESVRNDNIKHEEVDEDSKDKNRSSPASPKASTMSKKRKMKNPEFGTLCNCKELRTNKCVLETKDLWDKFCDYETEMIVTNVGR